MRKLAGGLVLAAALAAGGFSISEAQTTPPSDDAAGGATGGATGGSAEGGTGTTEPAGATSAPGDAAGAAEETPAMEQSDVTIPADPAAVAGEWIAEDIGGEPTAEGAVSWLKLTKAGRAQGQGGCNGYSGSFTLDKGALGFGPLASTRRACPQPQMNQETRYFAALGEAKGARIEDGKLVLVDLRGDPLVILHRK